MYCVRTQSFPLIFHSFRYAVCVYPRENVKINENGKSIRREKENHENSALRMLPSALGMHSLKLNSRMILFEKARQKRFMK